MSDSVSEAKERRAKAKAAFVSNQNAETTAELREAEAALEAARESAGAGS